MKIKVAVLCGGPSPEYNVSLASGEEVLQNLNSAKFNAHKIVISRNGGFSPLSLKGEYDLAFLALHGPFGEDGTLQNILDETGLAYTGSSARASRIGMDKLASKEVFIARGIPTPQFLKVESSEGVREFAQIAGFPVVVKPANQGSSVGITVVKNKNALSKAFREAASYGPVLVEEFVAGRELTVGILANTPLPVVEIRSRRGFFDYQAKYDPALVEEIVPAPLSESQTAQAQNLAMKAFSALGCRGFGRVDMILRPSGEIVALEVNTIPGLTKNSLFPKELRAQGITLEDALEKIITVALGGER
ncbi:MAG: D-alanine--D-alanine ligase [Patescibacteria group bacterium]